MRYFGFRFIRLSVRKLECRKKINDYLYLYYFFNQKIPNLIKNITNLIIDIIGKFNDFIFNRKVI